MRVRSCGRFLLFIMGLTNSWFLARAYAILGDDSRWTGGGLRASFRPFTVDGRRAGAKVLARDWNQLEN